MTQSLGVAVIGAGMAGRAHAAGYRAATTMFDTDLPDIRLVAIADAHEPFALDAATYGVRQRRQPIQAAGKRAARIEADPSQILDRRLALSGREKLVVAARSLAGRTA